MCGVFKRPGSEAVLINVDEAQIKELAQMRRKQWRSEEEIAGLLGK